MYSELTLQDVSFLMLYGGASVLAVLAAQLSVVGMTVVGIVRHDWFLGYGVSHYCQLAIIAAFKQLRGISVTAWMKREGDRKGKAGL